ncbi:MAG: HNH endonuclease [Dehalococcoidia bacterium]
MLDSSVLVLNQNYEPLNICRTKRAVVLVLGGKADVIENNSNVVRSLSFSMTAPSVVRLTHLVKRHRREVKLTRRRVFIRDRYTCQYCGKETGDLTLDHVVPRRLGGEHSWENVVSACKACNQKKAGRTPQIAGMRLLKKPFRPPPVDYYVFCPFHVPTEWQKYLSLPKSDN